MANRLKRPDCQKHPLTYRERFTSKHLSELSSLALQSDKIISKIHGDLYPENGDIDYDKLARSTIDLAQTVKITHNKNPKAVGYSSWMLLLRLADTLYTHPAIESEPDSDNQAWKIAWETARQTATGREIVEKDPVLQRVLSQPTPSPYKEVYTQNIVSDPRYANRNLDNDYYNHVESLRVAAPTERSAQIIRPKRQVAKVAIRSSGLKTQPMLVGIPD